MPLLTVPRAALLAGPVALAFFAGGYGDRPRLVALAVAGLALAWSAAAGPWPGLPPSRAARAALGAFAALVGWVALSASWAPLADAARADFERWALYGAAGLAGVLCWRARGAARVVEPALAAGTTLVTTYGLSGRLVPSLVPQTASASAGGRFEQPLTYWNASGMLAAFGLVLCARIAGDADRPAWARCAAVAAAVPLGTGVYLSFSRGALAALAAGLVVLVVCAPTWTQLRSLVVTLEVAVYGLAGPAASPAVRQLAGSAADRRREGALVGLVLLLTAAAGAALQAWALREERRGGVRAGSLRLPRWSARAATALVVALVLLPVLLARGDGGAASTDPGFGATPSRLASTGSHRYDYWKVALRAWADHPIEGLGSGGYAVAWLRERPQPERIRDAHSLPLETLAELGGVGALLLLGAAGGLALAARGVLAADPVLAAGPVAGLVVYAVHASIDWDWELPATGLMAVALAALLLARAPRRGATPR